MPTSLSIIIPVYNGEKWLHRLFKTLELQGIFTDDCIIEAEVIFVDDSSTDKSADMLHEFASLHDNVRVLSQKNSGQGAARNLGLTESRCDFVYFMDCDDILAPDTLTIHTLQLAETDADILRFRFDYCREADAEKLLYDRKDSPLSLEEKTLRQSGREYIIKTNGLHCETSVCTSIVRKNS